MASTRRDTKPNLDSNQFEQFSNNVLSLSGRTNILNAIVVGNTGPVSSGITIISTGGTSLFRFIDDTLEDGHIVRLNADGSIYSVNPTAITGNAKIIKRFPRFNSDLDTVVLEFFDTEIQDISASAFDEIDSFSFEARLDTDTGFTTIAGTDATAVTNLETWVSTNTSPGTKWVLRITVSYGSGETGESAMVIQYEEVTS